MSRLDTVDELDRVALTRDVPESGLAEGDVGTVVHRYEGGERYEVEFVAGGGRTVAVLTPEAPDLRALEDHDILHVRKRASV